MTLIDGGNDGLATVDRGDPGGNIGPMIIGAIAANCADDVIDAAQAEIASWFAKDPEPELPSWPYTLPE